MHTPPFGEIYSNGVIYSTFLLFNWFHLPKAIIEIVTILHADALVYFCAVRNKVKSGN